MRQYAGDIALALATLLSVSIACQPTNPGTVALPPSGRPECPTDGIAYPATRYKDRTVVNFTLTEIPISGPITNVPEYHDCQRFVRGDTYGPLVAIFAHHGLDSLFSQVTDSTTAAPMQAAAEIYSYDGDYGQLFIRQGFNCLYLVREKGSWRALMSWVDKNAEACLSPPTKYETLEVRPMTRPQFDGGDYPAVARWDWDPNNKQQYISIRCGNEWCEVGPNGFTPSAPLTVTLPPPGAVTGLAPVTMKEVQRVTFIKGWYDEQFLALPNGAAGLRPSMIRGTVIPHPMLDRMTDVTTFNVTWVPTSYIVIDAAPAEYADKLGLAQGLNQVFICSANWDQCPHPLSVHRPKCEAGADGKWWGKIVQPGGRATYFCVHRRTHPGVEIPGAVRWRWDPDDEKTWVRCPEGCCTVS